MGQRVGDVETPPQYLWPVLAPDDRRLLLTTSSASSSTDVWTIDTQRGTTTRLTFDEAADEIPVWSPDGARIVFRSTRDRESGALNSLYVRAANGTGADERLLSGKSDELLAPFDWSRDGRFLVFVRGGIDTWQSKLDLWTLEMSGERTAAPLIDSPFRKEMAKFSPDSRWIAYTSNESNTFQVFVQPFPDIGRGKWQVSTRGGWEPRWRADGRELYYLDPGGVLMAVDVNAVGDVFEPGQPRPLFRTALTVPASTETPDYLYAVTGDGERFLINEPVAQDLGAAATEGGAPPSLKVIVNWAAGLAPP